MKRFRFDKEQNIWEQYCYCCKQYKPQSEFRAFSNCRNCWGKYKRQKSKIRITDEDKTRWKNNKRIKEAIANLKENKQNGDN